ncbi:Unknown protein [Striga hermonthica]|uniref:Uncharacterized protein n=1 Tax=Striga hermonthica TaxID=68872 RepID=A0A9N7MIW8_STRHE|nr:Unknown protein [Striga hermonthica]
MCRCLSTHKWHVILRRDESLAPDMSILGVVRMKSESLDMLPKHIRLSPLSSFDEVGVYHMTSPRTPTLRSFFNNSKLTLREVRMSNNLATRVLRRLLRLH